MKTRMLSVCFIVISMLGTQLFAQECTTCSAANPCNTCSACCSRPVELFAGLKNLMACRSCTTCEVPAPVCEAPAAPVAPACAPAVDCNAGKCDICKPNFSFKKICIKPCKAKTCGSCGVCDVCTAAPACAPVAEPTCAPVCAEPCFPCVREAIHRPVCGVGRVFSGLFGALADMTAPKCDCGLFKNCGCAAPVCDIPADSACAPVAPSCGPIEALPASPAVQAAPAPAKAK